MIGPSFRRLFAAFLLGAVVGAAALMGAVAAQVERVALQRDLFMTLAREQRQSLQQMRTQLEEFQTRPVVKSVEIHIINMDADGSRTALSLTEELRRISASVVGQVVEEVDPLLLRSLYHERTITLDRDHYLIQVESVVVAPTIHFFIYAYTEGEAMTERPG